MAPWLQPELQVKKMADQESADVFGCAMSPPTMNLSLRFGKYNEAEKSKRSLCFVFIPIHQAQAGDVITKNMTDLSIIRHYNTKKYGRMK